MIVAHALDVRLQGTRRLELGVANRTLERRAACVHGCVLREEVARREELAAVVALECFADRKHKWRTIG